ncbi:MAG: type II secretion system protein [Dehalococcoidales bacterium]|nr:MAG: type II secretion system protein [Dehalococcoidales bacterium]
MKIHDYKLRSKHGFTLIEILVGMALTGILITGVVVTIFQVNVGTAQNENNMYALRQVQTAGYYISNDVLQARCIGLGVDDGFPLTLSWTDPNPDTGREYYVQYDYYSDTRALTRTDLISNSTTRVADSIDSTISFTENSTGYFIFTVTASMSGYQSASATRTYEIEPRLENVEIIDGT